MLEKFLRCLDNYKSGEGRLNSIQLKNEKVEFELAKGFFFVWGSFGTLDCMVVRFLVWVPVLYCTHYTVTSNV